MFDQVVKLSTNQRMEGTSDAQTLFKDMLKRLRTGDSSEEDWKLLLSRQPSLIRCLDQFQDAIRLFYGNAVVMLNIIMKNVKSSIDQELALMHVTHQILL